MSQSYGVMLHHFTDSRHVPVPGAITGDEFRLLLNALQPLNLIGAQTWMEQFGELGRAPEGLVLTFDDALLSQYEIALPILREFGLDAFWFVYTAPLAGETPPLEIYRLFRSVAFDGFEQFADAFLSAASSVGFEAVISAGHPGFLKSAYLADFTFYSEAERWFRYVRDEILREDNYNIVMAHLIRERGYSAEELGEMLWLTDDHLRELAAGGHVIGLHSHTHPIKIAQKTREEQSWEYSQNAHHLERIIGAKPTVMAHPTNSYNADTLDILKAMGVQVGFRANNVMENYSNLELPRVDHADLMQKYIRGGRCVSA